MNRFLGNWDKVAAADIFYSAGFFLTPPEGPDVMEKVAKHAAQTNKVTFEYCI